MWDFLFRDNTLSYGVIGNTSDFGSEIQGSSPCGTTRQNVLWYNWQHVRFWLWSSKFESWQDNEKITNRKICYIYNAQVVELVDTPAWGAGPDYGVQVQVLSWAQIWITTLCNRPSIIVTYIPGQDLVAAKIGISRKRPIRLSVYTIHIIWEISSAG